MFPTQFKVIGVQKEKVFDQISEQFVAWVCCDDGLKNMITRRERGIHRTFEAVVEDISEVYLGRNLDVELNTAQ